MRKKYTANAKGFIVIVSPVVLLWFILAITGVNPLKGSLYLIIFLSLYIFIFTKGFYILLQEERIINVQGFFPKKIDVGKITHISLQQMYKEASGLKSLYVFYKDKDDKSRYSHISLGLYKFDTLASLINDLKVLNPKIEVDEALERRVLKINKLSPRKSSLFGATYLSKRDLRVFWIGMGGIAFSVILFFLLGFGLKEYFSQGFLPLIFPLILGIGIFFAGYLLGGGKIKSGFIGTFGFWGLLLAMYLVSLLAK